MVNVDLSEVAELMNMGPAIKAAAEEAARDLAAMIHAKSVELASQRLHSRREMFVSNLKYSQMGNDMWVVSLDGKARWIDDGQPEHSMLDALLRSPKAKRAKDGSKYVIVPFDHSPGQSKANTGPVEADMINVIKGEMKRRGIPFGKIETDSAGQAKIGKLHSFDIKSAPLKTGEGAGQGHGPIGEAKQGPTGTPWLARVNVYQSKDAKGKVKRGVLTFRTASSKHAGQQRWDHPGNPGVNIMEDAAAWAQETFDREIAPALVGKIMIDVSK